MMTSDEQVRLLRSGHAAGVFRVGINSGACTVAELDRNAGGFWILDASGNRVGGPYEHYLAAQDDTENVAKEMGVQR